MNRILRSFGYWLLAISIPLAQTGCMRSPSGFVNQLPAGIRQLVPGMVPQSTPGSLQ